MSHAQRKRIYCSCHGAIAAGPQYRTHWEDIWLKWQAKPGRQWYYAAPMVGTRADLEAESWLSIEVQRKHPEHDYREDITYNERMLAALDSAPFARDTHECPNVYTNAKYIDRAEAERMLTWFLLDAHGIANPKFVWKKATAFAHSVSFAGIDKGDEESETHVDG